VERTAIHRRVEWRTATVVERRKETDSASTLELHVAGWPGHDAGQHVDVRLTAADGYTAVRTYSIASAPDGDNLELTIELLPDGEVSPYLVESVAPGSPVDVLGPIGGWFVWHPEQTEPIQLIAGGSGIVPLMCMLRTRAQHNVTAPFHLLYSVRGPESIYYADELARLAAADFGAAITFAYTRTAPPNWPAKPQRVRAELIATAALPASQHPTAYVCGPTAFVEVVAGMLTQAGYDASRIKTERFGPTGK
jgi:ferredoxin-NADP reductase